MPTRVEEGSSVVWQRSRLHVWSKTRVQLNEVRCNGPFLWSSRQCRRPRFAILLDEIGGHCEAQLAPATGTNEPRVPQPVSFVPGGVDIWLQSHRLRYHRNLAIAFDTRIVEEELLETVKSDLPTEPWLHFQDDHLLRLSRLIAETFDDVEPADSLYGSSLLTALLARFAVLCRSGRRSLPAQVRGLAPSQLRKVIEYMDQEPQRIKLRELALLAGLSQSQFCQAFKVSTGMPPYQWHLAWRVRRAQDALLREDTPIASVAVAAGFADQPHFTRVFKRVVGTTPSIWRRQQRQ